MSNAAPGATRPLHATGSPPSADLLRGIFVLLPSHFGLFSLSFPLSFLLKLHLFFFSFSHHLPSFLLFFTPCFFHPTNLFPSFFFTVFSPPSVLPLHPLFFILFQRIISLLSELYFSLPFAVLFPEYSSFL